MATATGELALASDACGLVVGALGLHLDPREPSALAFVSHAHAARAASSARILATPETIARLGLAVDGASATPMPYGERIELPLANGGVAALFTAPAGHMAGAAQLVVEHAGGRFVYTGDVRPGATRTASPFELVACDELAITSTFALPIFRFPPRDHELDALAAFCRERIAAGESPVVLTRDDEEIAFELAARQVPCARGEEAEAKVKRGKGGLHRALLMPPNRKPQSKGMVALASGLALLDASLEQTRADAAFFLSDHADSDALVAIAIGCGAKLVHTTHGDAEVLARLLVDRGVVAVPIELPPIDEGL